MFLFIGYLSLSCNVSVIQGDITSSKSLNSSRIKALGGTSSRYCAQVDDAVWCWGTINSILQLTPVKVPTLESGVVKFAGYGETFCALKVDGNMYCFGEGTLGQLGDGTVTPIDIGGGYYTWDGGSTHYAEVPVKVAFPTGVSKPVITNFSMGYRDICALANNGRIWCWGRSLGAAPIQFPPFSSQVRLLEMGQDNFSACVLLVSNQLICWEGGEDGNFPSLTSMPIPYPNSVTNAPTGITNLAIDDSSSYCVVANAKGYCWESYDDNGPIAPEDMIPTLVPGLESGVDKIMGQDNSFCALMLDKTVKCWGRNNRGELGNGTIDETDYETTTAVTVNGVSNVSAIGEKEWDPSVCVGTTDNQIYCWGSNEGGVLGSLGVGLDYTPTPIRIPSSW